jgi:hypothetical protein
MFQEAVKRASDFTFPVIISRKTVGGTCSSMIGTFVVINKEGWIVTAGHILSKWHQLAQGAEATREALAQQAAIKADASLTNKERARRLNAGIHVGKEDSQECSIFLAWPNVTLTQLRFFPATMPDLGEVIDLGIAKLEPFDSGWVLNYPVFKDWQKDFEPGRSLCKLGFPFHQFTPTWDPAARQFILPPGALPLPRFPIEGIFTRTSEILFEGPDKPPFPVRYVETSSPGFLGQSGGPTFDVKGTIWAIQAKTAHLALGFAGQNQYFNVGLGVHPATMFPIFDEAGVKYLVSDY